MAEYLTTADVAHLCRTSPETVRYWRHIGYGPPSFKVGRRVLYDAAKARQWLDETEAAQAAAANG
jgi:DNA-binding transcriptional MerR regulator